MLPRRTLDFRMPSQLDEGGNRRFHRYKLFKPREKNKVKSNSLFIRVINDWDAISNEMVSAETLSLDLD